MQPFQLVMVWCHRLVGMIVTEFDIDVEQQKINYSNSKRRVKHVLCMRNRSWSDTIGSWCTSNGGKTTWQERVRRSNKTQSEIGSGLSVQGQDKFWPCGLSEWEKFESVLDK